MKIVIDIPEERYEEYKRIGDSRDILFEAIRKGTIFPEHHGRLIDADALLKEHPEFDIYPFPSTTINRAPTIIEADKGGE